jgi:hypothetical protein
VLMAPQVRCGPGAEIGVAPGRLEAAAGEQAERNSEGGAHAGHGVAVHAPWQAIGAPTWHGPRKTPLPARVAGR